MLSRLVFVLLLVASLWDFSRTVYRRLHHKIQPTPPLQFDHFTARIWRVFSEVFLQSRVIRDRPVAGMLHALVMWGFFAFAWVSIRHLWLGFVGIDSATPHESWYGDFAAIWAVAVLIGIGGLAFRRFVVRPRVIGPVSLSSGLVA